MKTPNLKAKQKPTKMSLDQSSDTDGTPIAIDETSEVPQIVNTDETNAGIVNELVSSEEDLHFVSILGVSFFGWTLVCVSFFVVC